MLLALLFLGIASEPIPSLAWPIGPWSDTALGFDLTTDYVDGYYGPWSPDYLQSARWLAPYGLPGDYMYPHMDAPFHTDWHGGHGDLHGGHGMDYYYGGYGPKTMDIAKENYVRDYPFGGTEFGMRDSVTVRPGAHSPFPGRLNYPYLPPPYLPRAPGLRSLDRFYNPFNGDDLFADHASPYYKRLLSSGLAAPRPSSLRTGGDFMFLRR